MQGPSAEAAHPSPNGAITMLPWLTAASVCPAWVRTTKSVPRTPMATNGVFRRKRSLAAWAASPEMARVTPWSSRKRTVDSAGRAGLY